MEGLSISPKPTIPRSDRQHKTQVTQAWMTSSSPALFWVNKTARSRHLSHSDRNEHSEIFRHVHAARLRKSRRPSRFQPNVTPSTKSMVEREIHLREIDQHGTNSEVSCSLEEDALFQAGFGDRREQDDGSVERPLEQAHESSSLSTGNLSSDQSMMQMPSFPSWSTTEKRAFHFFLDQRKLTKQRVSLARPDDSTLWDDTIPQGAEVYSFVRDLLIAVASFHETLYIEKIDRARTVSLRILAYEYCSKAVEALSTFSENLSDDWLIITCILFVRLHLFKSDFNSATTYLQAALRFYERVKNGTGSETSTSSMLYRTGIFATIRSMKVHSLLNGWSPKTKIQSRNPLRITLPQLKTPFSSIDQIRDYVEMLTIIPVNIINSLSESTYLDPDSTLARDFHRLHNTFEFWWQEYRNREILKSDQPVQYVQNLRPSKSSFTNTPYILFQCVALGADETAFDQCIDRFAAMTANVRMFLKENGHLLFGIHHSIPVTVKALWFSATCCRDPVIRREAILLLRTYNRQESGIDSWTAGVVADKLMSIEEEGLIVRHASDIPENRRVRFVGCAYVPEERKVRLQYKRSTEQKIEEAWMECDTLIKHNAVSEEDTARFQALVQLCACYTKASPEQAPRGFVRPMIYNDQEMTIIATHQSV